VSTVDPLSVAIARARRNCGVAGLRSLPAGDARPAEATCAAARNCCPFRELETGPRSRSAL